LITVPSEGLAYLNGWVRFGFGSLDEQDSVVDSRDDLPLEDSSFLQALGRMLADDRLLGGDEVPDRVEQLPHP
jgi:hypothetical protein